MKYLLALDQGTSSSRAIIFDLHGNIVGMVRQEIELLFPKLGWVEQDPMQLYDSVRHCIEKILANSPVNIQNIVAVGLTNQRETTIVWNKDTGIPLYNAIVWQDRRTADECNRLNQQGYGNLIQDKTGLLLDPYFCATKLKWILDTIPGARSLAKKGDLLFGTVDCYLLWNLTGRTSHCTDISNASRTMLFNIHNREWDDDLLELFSIPRQMLPEVKNNSAEFGNLHINDTVLPILGMAGDQHAAIFAQACYEPGMAKCTYGTGAFMLLNTGPNSVTSRNKLLSTVAYSVGDQYHYALEGSIFTAGAAVGWLRDKLGIIENAAQTETISKQLQDNGGVYFVPAFAGLGAPHWDPHARGTLVGLTGDSHRAHIIRAVLESVAYQTKDLLDAMAADGAVISQLRVDGGMTTNDWLMQFIADVLNIPIEKTEITEITALGGAYFAGLTAGVFKSTDDLAAQWHSNKRFEPALSDDKREELLEGWRRGVSQALTYTRRV